jgi:serine/threonine-protein kinase
VTFDSQDHTVVIHVVPGQVLDQRWRIESRVGQGAMGSVFRGRDLQANRVVAIKILAPEHCRKPKVLARFEREADTMTELRHPNIVQLYGHGRHGLLPYIVMEFLDGLTLADALQKYGGTLGLPESVAVVKQVAAGLSFLHHHGLVHRDVKPQNIVIGAGGRVTILDLGVVRDQHNPGLTRPGAMVGTPYYMSPEQIYGVDDIDRRTDVYALAAMTFELLVGRPPFLGNNNFEVLYGHKNLPAPDASQMSKAVPKPVAQVLARGLSKRREERPDTVSELIADLEAAAGPKKVDLGKVFAAVGAPKRIAEERTRVVQRHQPKREPLEEDELPMADSEDVDSVAGVSAANVADVGTGPGDDGGSLPDTGDLSGEGAEEKTVLLRVDATFVGEAPKPRARVNQKPPPPVPDAPPAPNPRQERTSAMPSLQGELQVAAAANRRAVKATVLVDGVVRGTTPCTVALPVGEHEVRVELAGFRPADKLVEIGPGQLTSLRVPLDS